MSRIGLLSEAGAHTAALEEGLVQQGYVCVAASPDETLESWLHRESPQAVLLQMSDASRVPALAAELRKAGRLPVIALISPEVLHNVNGHLDGVDDFVLAPYDPGEIAARVKRALHKHKSDGDEAIRVGDLLIDLANCEVSLAGRPVEMTFREYELLKFLARNPGRTYTRETLLDRVWGYDYYGGDRTVDVHIRRLRSKLEDAEHSFIDTVRNIGYRFRKSS